MKSNEAILNQINILYEKLNEAKRNSNAKKYIAIKESIDILERKLYENRKKDENYDKYQRR